MRSMRRSGSGRREGTATMTATPMSDLGVDVTTGEYGDDSTDVVIRRCIECFV
jgi:hypothetical protein